MNSRTRCITGFLFKYDKDGCRVANCRLPNSTEEVEGNTVRHEFFLYPNPVYDILKIRRPDIGGEVDLEIIDYTGRTLFRGKLNEGLNEVDVGHFSSGLYLATFSKEGNVLSTERFVKQ